MKRYRVTSLVVVTLATLALVVSYSAASTRSDANRVSATSNSLTPYGRQTYELDALLHHALGERLVYLRFWRNFTSNFVPVAFGGIYHYTFADGSDSSFKLTKPLQLPKAIRVNGLSDEPLTLRGDHIACGHNQWLYDDSPAGSANEFAGCLASPGDGSTRLDPRQLSASPIRLTSYGRDVWELDALLHATFGGHRVYVAYGGSSASSSFTTNFIAAPSGGVYDYTFAEPSHSTFKLMRPARAPRPWRGATGGPSYPLTVRGAYISCGRQRWIYEDEAGGNVNEFVDCLKSAS